MGVDRGGWQLCHLAYEEGGAHVEEGDNVLDVQLFAGVWQAAETLPN